MSTERSLAEIPGILYADCANCGGRVFYMETAARSYWCHHGNGGVYCPPTMRAEPKPGTQVIR